MMGRLNHDQEQFFYSFRLDEAVPDDHPVREVAAVLDLSWVHSELAPYYPRLGRPSIDPVLMIRMLIIGYVFAIRSERAICRDVRENLDPPSAMRHGGSGRLSFLQALSTAIDGGEK
jgi:transposase